MKTIEKFTEAPMNFVSTVSRYEINEKWSRAALEDYIKYLEEGWETERKERLKLETELQAWQTEDLPSVEELEDLLSIKKQNNRQERVSLHQRESLFVNNDFLWFLLERSKLEEHRKEQPLCLVQWRAKEAARLNQKYIELNRKIKKSIEEEEPAEVQMEDEPQSLQKNKNNATVYNRTMGLMVHEKSGLPAQAYKWNEMDFPSYAKYLERLLDIQLQDARELSSDPYKIYGVRKSKEKLLTYADKDSNESDDSEDDCGAKKTTRFCFRCPQGYELKELGHFDCRKTSVAEAIAAEEKEEVEALQKAKEDI